jgi:hypothetical protein
MFFYRGIKERAAGAERTEWGQSESTLTPNKKTQGCVMARKLRIDLPGYAYHVIQRGVNRQACFLPMRIIGSI